MIVVNLFAGPGSGKSTTAAETFALLKRAGIKAELVTEVAKDLTWEQPGGKWATFQLRLLAEQAWRIERLRDTGVDVVVTDSPVLLGMAYCPAEERSILLPVALREHNKHTNLNVFLVRTKPYVTVGRTQTEEEARQLDKDIRMLMQMHAGGGRVLYEMPDTPHYLRDLVKGML